MSIRNSIFIISIHFLFFSSAGYAGLCTEYIPQIVSIETADPKYLTYTDQWSATISPIANIATNPATPEKILNDLSKHRLLGVRVAVAKNPNTSLEILDTLFLDKNINVQTAVLSNPKATLKYFENFLNQPDYKYHANLADCWNAPPDILEKLYIKYEYDPSMDDMDRNALADKIANNPNTPERILSEIYKLNPSVRKKDLAGRNKSTLDVSADPKLFKKDLDALCKSKEYSTRIKVASNPNITAECIQALTSDFMEKGKIDLTSAFVKNGKIDLRAKDDYAAYSGRERVLSSLLDNQATPDSVLFSALYYARQYYYEGALLHKSVTALLSRPTVSVGNVLVYLKNEDKMLITSYSLEGDDIYATHISSPRGMGLFVEYKNILDRRLDKLHNDIERENFLKSASKSESIILRAYAAGNQLTPANVLEQLVDDQSLFVKLELAKNRHISESIIGRLSKVKEFIGFDTKNCTYD